MRERIEGKRRKAGERREDNSSGGTTLGPGCTAPPKSCPGPQIFVSG